MNRDASVLALGVAAGVAAYALHTRRRRSRRWLSGPDVTKIPASCDREPEILKSLSATPLALGGTLLIVVQNLAVSGANQVLLNLVEGTVWRGNVVLLTPSLGPFAREFSDLGVSIFVGTVEELLERVRDIRFAICNTIMTAHAVIELEARGISSCWVLHEWWPPEILTEELAKRNDRHTTPAIVADALAQCKRTVCVCEAQLKLYRPKHGFVSFVGVPEVAPSWKLGGRGKAEHTARGTDPSKSSWGSQPLTLLCLGIVCPRKNQHFAVEVFRQWAGDRKDVRLLVVGARYSRQYEIEYVEKVKAAAAGDPRVEVHDVTSEVDGFYRQADVLLFSSLNEVTPMVIAESMMRSIPVITTNIAGIPEMLVHRKHGYVLPPEKQAFVDALHELCDSGPGAQQRRLQMGAAARKHAESTFTNAAMVARFRLGALCLSAPRILLDMDGVVVDWDSGFRKAWGTTSPIDRTLSYSMEDCVPKQHRKAAFALYHSEGFFANLPPMEGALEAVRRLAARGYDVFFCTSPVLTSQYCAAEKYEWIIRNLGQAWAARVIVTSDKTAVRGDVLIDDKPKIVGGSSPIWQQLLFDAPYNKSVSHLPRLSRWAECETQLESLLRVAKDAAPAHVASPPESPVHGPVSRDAVASLPDFSHLLPPSYRNDYLAWRSGKSHGAKGEAFDAAARFSALQDESLNKSAEDFSEISVFRTGYSSWRRGGQRGARDIVLMRSVLRMDDEDTPGGGQDAAF